MLTVRNRNTGEIRTTTDLGRALNTRLWADIGKVRVLGLRGLASRAPYFHAGQAKNINKVPNFYTDRFNINLNHSKRASGGRVISSAARGNIAHRQISAGARAGDRACAHLSPWGSARQPAATVANGKT